MAKKAISPSGVEPRTTAEKVAVYETTGPLLRAMQEELRELAKKRPEATLSKSKVALVNRLLSDIKELLREESESKYLDLLDEETLPQYSDVVLICPSLQRLLGVFNTATLPWRSSAREASGGSGDLVA